PLPMTEESDREREMAVHQESGLSKALSNLGRVLSVCLYRLPRYLYAIVTVYCSLRILWIAQSPQELRIMKDIFSSTFPVEWPTWMGQAFLVYVIACTTLALTSCSRHSALNRFVKWMMAVRYGVSVSHSVCIVILFPCQ
ncbi:hypothetical protein KIPB_014523, partial [Kipferlia bialata]